MNIALKIQEPADFGYTDRPGWIPHDIEKDWDPNPYAYQTEEELMPAGGLHGQIIIHIGGILQEFLKTRNLMFLADTFMIYPDSLGIRQRTAPDLLLMPFRYPPPSSYDLDQEPPPLAVAEITSPKSRLKDLKNNVPFYTGLGIPAYLVIDAVTPSAELREEIGLYFWHKTVTGIRLTRPDADGRLAVPEMHVCITVRGQELIFEDIRTGQPLHGTQRLREIAEEEKQRTERERQRADAAEILSAKERQRAEREKQRAELLAAKLRELGIDPDDIAK
jgi:Uma2 family endonuclease